MYRAEIDGLRALAVVPVILFHAGFGLFSGGFVGVDVFFVISGYLITTILIEDIESGRFSIVTFYERRARRILPALFFVMLVCVPFAWMWMIPGQMKDFAQSLIAASLFASNILFWKESGYFDSAAEEKPLLHTWSLAVEEQYYVLFPVFLITTWRLGRDGVFWIICVMAAVSLMLSEWGWRNMATANFYLAPMRVWELLAGSISAFIVQKKGVQKNGGLALIGLAAIVFSIFAYDETTPFPSLYALAPVLGVMLLCLYGTKETIAARLLGTRVLVGIGLISYSAYLWHQPLFAFARIRLHEPREGVFVFLGMLSLGLAYLTWKFVETPFRKTIPSNYTKVQVFCGAGLGLASFALVGLLGHTSNGFEASTIARAELAKLADRTALNYGLNRMCNGNLTISSACATSDSPKVILWGDSFAMHLFNGLSASEPSIQLRQFTKGNCSPILGISSYNAVADKGHAWADRCKAFNDYAFDWISQADSVEFVVLSSPFGWVGQEQVVDENGTLHEPSIDFVLDRLAQTVRKIKETGTDVVLVSPTPRSGFDIGKCLVARYQFDDTLECDFLYSESSYQFEFIDKASAFVPVYWLYQDICSNGVCHAERDSIFIYRDSAHLSRDGSAYLGKAFDWYERWRAIATSETQSW